MVDPSDARPRRGEYAVNDDRWIREFLADQPAGVLGTVDDGQPFLTPLLFASDEPRHALYVHLSPEGRTAANVTAAPAVAFNVFEMGRILPATGAGSFVNEYASATIFGRARLLEDPEEKRRGLERLMEKFAPHVDPGDDYRPATRAKVDETGVIETEVEAWSGKRIERPDADGYRFEEV
ncbi:MAG: nitroimidazol reductase NimA-like FMN-containing flavoprotein [Halobacteriales archaeon]|jgi:nitroimidazol reductase NimA-like FMN-containing flavoprotein (pyridoxamine 5'-phosphate oxidase superfamily)